MGPINRKFFFDHARNSMFQGALGQSQVAGMTAILDYWEGNHGQCNPQWLAYILGTAFHETDRKMQPIHEYGSSAYFESRYGPPPKGKNPKLAKQLGNDDPGDGALYHGRGYCQLTGKRNYRDWSDRLGVDLVADPDQCLDPAVAARIIVDGAILGTFTGRRLASYFAPGKADWVGARRIINSLDKANNVAGYARQFNAAITYTG